MRFLPAYPCAQMRVPLINASKYLAISRSKFLTWCFDDERFLVLHLMIVGTSSNAPKHLRRRVCFLWLALSSPFRIPEFSP